MRPSEMRCNSMEQDSFDSFDDDAMLVMSTSNLRLNGDPDGLTAESGHDELPRSVIVTNIDLAVFDNHDLKCNFEAMFREFDPRASFCYLRSFRRIRVDFESHISASKAKANLDNTPVGQNIIHCYFIQVLSPCEDVYLRVPPLEKQFLISPPCSPPVGWEQPKEDRPVINYELLAAVAQLTPGEKHELHPTKEINFLGKSISTPSIVVQVAEDVGNNFDNDRPRLRIPPGVCGAMPGGTLPPNVKATRCPERQNSLD